MQINQDLSPFEAQVLQSLTRLETKMDDLAGSKDNTGRIPILEGKVTKLSIAVIVIAVLSTAALGPHAMAIVTWLAK